MNTTAILSFILAAAACSVSVAQTPDQGELNAGLQARIVALARAQEDGILLRWAVDKPAVWQEAMTTGYIVERAEATSTGRLPSPESFTNISGTAVTPWTPKQWEAFFASVPPVAEGQPDFPMLAAAVSEKDDGVPAVDLEDLAVFQEQKARFEMRFSLALYAADRNATAAEALGLRYHDKTAERGKAYVYRIRLSAPSSIYRVDTGYVSIVNTTRRTAAYRLVGATENDGWILLTWPGSRWSGARVERSADNGRTFSSITRAPLLNARPPGSPDTSDTFADTLVTNYRPYTYRVYGGTPFADEELIGEVTAMGRDRTPPGMPFVPNAKQIAARAVRITWTMDEPVANDLAGFMVQRDSTENGEYPLIVWRMLKKDVREFIDTTFSDFDPNYYIVAAYDTAGNVSRSMPSYVAIVDSTSPAVPRWLKGTMDSTGAVTLVLRANPERDVMGYRILRANAPDHEFSSINEWFGRDGMSAAKDTVIMDTVTVQSLTKNVYYRATALDFHFNESDMSEILTVTRPDKVPPVAPVITGADVTDSSVTIEFTPGGSPDVANHLLYRRIAGETGWGTPAVIAAEAQSAFDRDVKSNVTYEYAMQAVDSAGNRSELSASVLARPYLNAVLPAVSGLTVRYDEAKGQMVLAWQYSGKNDDLRFMIYRSVNGAGLKKYAVAGEASARSFSDTSLQGKGVYEYAVKALSTTAESGMSGVARGEVK